MRLPILKYDENKELPSSTCLGHDNCASCSLFEKNGGRCGGCTATHKERLNDNFLSCFKECGECAGHKVRVPGVCCRSPMKDIYLTAVAKGSDYNNPSFTYTDRPLLQFKQRAVFYVSSGGVNTITAGGKQLVPDGTEVVAVNLTRVWGGNGFYSQDLKDYLHLPAKTKLVLMTMTLDDLLERAWNSEFYSDSVSYQRAGIDAWMPLSFSAYPEEANMHQYYQTLRTLYCTEQSKAWFTTGDHYLPLVKTDDLVLASVKAIPQMVFNTQFVANEVAFKYQLKVLKHYHTLVPPHVGFWLVGATTPTFMHNVRKQCGDRALYFLSAKPLYLAAKGQELRLGGGSKSSKAGKLDLVYNNFATFADMVSRYG